MTFKSDKMRDIIYDLEPKGDGTYYPPKIKTADGYSYVPYQYRNVDKRCKCRKDQDGFCLQWLGKHKIHTCSECGGVMSSCKPQLQSI